MAHIFSYRERHLSELPSPGDSYGLYTTEGRGNQAGARQLSFDTRCLVALDAITYPASGKTGLLPSLRMYRDGVKVDYWEGEEDPGVQWQTHADAGNNKQETG